MTKITIDPPVDLMKLKDGRHPVEGSKGLRLIVRGGSRAWEFRYTLPGETGERYLSLGPYNPVNGLSNARKARDEMAELIRAGGCPKSKRETEKEAAREERRRFEAEPSYRDFVMAMEGILPENPRSAAAMLRYGVDILGDVADLKPHQITAPKLKAALEPHWHKSGAIREAIKYVGRFLKIAKEEGLIPDQGWTNPARMKTLQRNIKAKLKPVTPRKAIDFDSLPDAMAALRLGPTGKQDRLPFLLVELLALTGLRSNEVAYLRHSYVDRVKMVIAVPREMMKGKMAGCDPRLTHFKVPLTQPMIRVIDRALDLAPARKPDSPIFPSKKSTDGFYDDGTVLDVLEHIGFRDPQAPVGERTTIHGFRSTFMDWAMSQTRAILGDDGKPMKIDGTEVTEPRWSALMVDMCLAHVPKDKVQRAYFRDLPVDPRRGIMQVWNAALEPKVVELAARRPAAQGGASTAA